MKMENHLFERIYIFEALAQCDLLQATRAMNSITGRPLLCRTSAFYSAIVAA